MNRDQDDERDPQRCSQGGLPPAGPDATRTTRHRRHRPAPFRAWLASRRRRRQLDRRRVREFDRLGFHELATYNAEKGRGVVHTPATQARMADVQARYDLWAQEVRDA